MSPFNRPRPIWKLEHPSLFVKEDFSYLLATQRRVAVKLDELWDMFLKSRSQSSTSGKLPRLEPTSTVRMASLFWPKNAKFLPQFGNGLLLPSSLHSKLCLRSTGIGAPSIRTTGASFRSKEWAFGPFPCFSSYFPSCSYFAYFLLSRQTRLGSLASLARPC